MNNEQLYSIFTNLQKAHDNIFDVYIELTDYAEAYSTMEIASIIPNIYEAYEVFCKHQDKTERIIQAISSADWSKLVDAFDITKLFDQIPEEYRDTFLTLLEEQGRV